MKQGHTGLKRIGIATVNSWKGLKAAWKFAAAFRENTALALDFQQAMSEPPWYFAPVNKNVVLSEDSAKILPSAEQYPNLITINFEVALPLREDLTNEFIQRYGQ